MKPWVMLSAKWKIHAAVFLLALGLSFLCCAPLFSQGSAGRILGTVTDSNGGVVSGATVVVLDVDRGTSRPLTTDESGAFNAPNLLPGNYKVRVEFKGFKTTERQSIVLEVGQEIRVDLSLQPGEQAQTITVTEEIPLVETTNAELGGTIQSAVINDLPLNGRNFENLLTLRPGVEVYSGGGGWTQSSNGLRPHDNMYLVEGVNSNDPWMAQSIMNAGMAAGDAGTILPIDAIDEFKTIENPRAEYGWKPGAVVNVGIKSGTNAFHGSGYAYGRSDAFDAVDLYSERVPVSLEQFGASIGGPIKKDKLFFFGNFESQRYSIASPFQHNVPDTSPTATDPVESLVGACQGVLNSGGTVAPLSAHLAGITVAGGSCTMPSGPGLFPVSNGSNTLETALTSNNLIYSGVGKMDYHLNDKNSLSGMFFMSPGSGTFVDNPIKQIDSRWLTVQYARAIVGSVGWTYVPSSAWVNSFRFGYSHYYQTFVTPDSTVNPTTYGIYTGVTSAASFGLPIIGFSGAGFQFQLGGSWPKTVGPDAVTQFSDSVSYLRGNHSFKFGGEFMINQDTNQVTNNTKGPVTFAATPGGFSTLENFFAGNLKSAKISTGNFVRNLSDHGIAAFVQDDWRITHKLTVNAGLRYEFTSILKDKNNLVGNFSPTNGLEQVGVGGYNTPYNPDHRNFSPRLGFAWDIAGNGKTVVRGGGSLLYEQASFDSFMAVGNLYGLRVNPTGVPIYTCSNNTNPCTAPNPVVTAVSGGLINAGAISFTGPALKGPSGIDARWQNNSSSEPLYAASPACGDGTVAEPNGITPGPCTILGVDQNLRTPYVTTWSLGIQRALTNSLSLDVSYVGNHATKLVGLSDLNQPAIGSGWGSPTDGTGTGSAASGSPAYVCLNDFVTNGGPYTNCSPGAGTLPFASKYPYLGNILWLSNDNFSNYNSLQVSVTQHATHGWSYVLGYTYSHALGESPDNWSFVSPINSANPREIYGTTQFDIRHRFTFSTTYEIPGINVPAQLLKGWSLNAVVTLEGALPWGVNDLTTDFSGTNEINSPSPNGEQWDFFGNPADFQETKALSGTNVAGGVAQGGLPYFPGTSNPTCLTHSTAMGALAIASLTDLGCYASLNGKSVLVPPAYGTLGTTAPNMFRGMPFYNVDFSVTKMFKFGERLNAEFRAEFFNIFNRATLANPYGGPGGSNAYTDPSADAGASFGFQPATADTVSSNPVLGTGGARAIQLGLKLTF
jgi:hypothetical protein